MAEFALIQSPVQAASAAAVVEVTAAQYSALVDIVKNAGFGSLVRRTFVHLDAALPEENGFNILTVDLGAIHKAKGNKPRRLSVSAAQQTHNITLPRTIERALVPGGLEAIVQILDFIGQEIPNIPVHCHVVWEYSLKDVEPVITLPYVMPVAELGEMTIVHGLHLTNASASRSLLFDRDTDGKNIRITARFEADSKFDRRVIEQAIRRGKELVSGVLRPVGGKQVW